MESSTAQFLLRQSACVQLPMIVTIVMFTLTGICGWNCCCSIVVAMWRKVIHLSKRSLVNFLPDGEAS